MLEIRVRLPEQSGTSSTTSTSAAAAPNHRMHPRTVRPDGLDHAQAVGSVPGEHYLNHAAPSLRMQSVHCQVREVHPGPREILPRPRPCTPLTWPERETRPGPTTTSINNRRGVVPAAAQEIARARRGGRTTVPPDLAQENTQFLPSSAGQRNPITTSPKQLRPCTTNSIGELTGRPCRGLCAGTSVEQTRRPPESVTRVAPAAPHRNQGQNRQGLCR